MKEPNAASYVLSLPLSGVTKNNSLAKEKINPKMLTLKCIHRVAQFCELNQVTRTIHTKVGGLQVRLVSGH